MNLRGDFLIKRLCLYIGLIILTFGCTNPFAPKLSNGQNNQSGLISDLKNIDGIFKNMQYAYTFKDTLIYGQLLDQDFTFTYRDYDQGVDQSWGRQEEMRATNGLFLNTQSLELTWNNIISITSDSTNVVRSFDLTVTFNPTDIEYVNGRVNLALRKNEKNEWKIVQWKDESNF